MMRSLCGGGIQGRGIFGLCIMTIPFDGSEEEEREGVGMRVVGR